jgi:hypothetical protein
MIDAPQKLSTRNAGKRRGSSGGKQDAALFGEQVSRSVSGSGEYLSG